MTDAELDAMIAYARSMPEGWSLHKYADAIVALREQLAAKDRDVAAIRELMNVYNLGGWTDAIAPMKRALAAEAVAAALRVERDAAFALLRVCQDSVHPDTRTVIQALIGDAAMLAGKDQA